LSVYLSSSFKINLLNLKNVIYPSFDLGFLLCIFNML
jgi:hypothetical protein